MVSIFICLQNAANSASIDMSVLCGSIWDIKAAASHVLH